MENINVKDLYREYHYTARHEDILINSRTTIFFTANAFIFAGFIANLEKLPQYYILAVIPFIFMQFSNYFYFSFILPAEISLKNIWDKIKTLEENIEDKKLSTYQNRETSFSKHRLLLSHVPYLNYIRIVTLSWFVVSIISIQKISKNLYEYKNASIMTILFVLILVVFIFEVFKEIFSYENLSVKNFLKHNIFTVIIIILEVMVILDYSLGCNSLIYKPVIFIFIYLLFYISLRFLNGCYRVFMWIVSSIQLSKFKNDSFLEDIISHSGIMKNNKR